MNINNGNKTKNKTTKKKEEKKNKDKKKNDEKCNVQQHTVAFQNFVAFRVLGSLNLYFDIETMLLSKKYFINWMDVDFILFVSFFISILRIDQELACQ